MNKSYLKAYVTKIAENKYRAIASTDAVDRYGDIVDQNGWMLEDYMKNPVMLWAHDSNEIPVAKCTNVDRSQNGKMIVDFEFNSADGSPLAPFIKNSYDNGFLNALSVGFLGHERNGNIITKAELLEISFVPVPANQEALRLAMTKGLDLSKNELGDIRADIEKAIEALKKGEVSDELDAEEAYEQKWEKFEEVMEAVNALYTVYMDEKTPVEDFGKLLTETIDLLEEVVANDGIDEDDKEEAKNAVQAKLKAFLGGREVKAGKTISKKNAAVIEACMKHMKLHMDTMGDHMKTHQDHYSALEEMLNTSASSEEGSGKSLDSAKEPATLSLEEAKIVRQQVRSLDSQAGSTLSILNRFISNCEK